MFDVNLIFRTKCIEQHNKYGMFWTGTSLVLLSVCLVLLNLEWCRAWKTAMAVRNTSLVLVEEWFWMSVLRAMPRKIPTLAGLLWAFLPWWNNDVSEKIRQEVILTFLCCQWIPVLLMCKEAKPLPSVDSSRKQTSASQKKTAARKEGEVWS